MALNAAPPPVVSASAAESASAEPTSHGRFGQLVAVLAHELRNPLASALAGLSAVNEMTSSADPRSAFLQRAYDDVERVSELMECYLEFGQQGTLRREPVDLVGLATALERRYRERVSVSSETERVVVRGDANMLGRVLENLVDNALEAGASSVHVDVGRLEGSAVLLVTDDGPGLGTQLGSQIFRPFVSGRGGSGLGLALATDVIGALGGTIATVPSERGACFRITLP